MASTYVQQWLAVTITPGRSAEWVAWPTITNTLDRVRGDGCCQAFRSPL